MSCMLPDDLCPRRLQVPTLPCLFLSIQNLLQYLPRPQLHRPLQTASTPSSFNLSMAVSAQRFGRRFLPLAAVTVSAKMQSDIIQGKNINLAALLLPLLAIEQQMVDCGDMAVFLKTSDPRLQRNLSFGEFVIAFGIYSDILCQTFPDRREELDLYLDMLADFSQRYGGTLFYNITSPSQQNLLPSLHCTTLDWFITDCELLLRHFGGHRTLVCPVHSSHGHSVAFCP